MSLARFVFLAVYVAAFYRQVFSESLQYFQQLDWLLLFEVAVENVRDKWNYNKNCLLSAEVMYPQELEGIRETSEDMQIFISGVNTKEGNLEKSLSFGFNSSMEWVIISASSGIIYSSSGEDFAEAARRETKKLHERINAYREVSLEKAFG